MVEYVTRRKVVHRETAANVPAYVQKVIFGSHIQFGMYDKIFSKIKIKNDWPHEKQ